MEYRQRPASKKIDSSSRTSTNLKGRSRITRQLTPELTSQPCPPIFHITPGERGGQSLQSSRDIVRALPESVITQSVLIFSQRFPELAFLHFSNFSGSIQSYESLNVRVFISSVLALCARFLPSDTPRLSHSEEYAVYARDGLSTVVTEPPSILTIQALLIVAMYEWGNRNGYRAWMYSGKSLHPHHYIRMVLTADRDSN